MLETSIEKKKEITFEEIFNHMQSDLGVDDKEYSKLSKITLYYLQNLQFKIVDRFAFGNSGKDCIVEIELPDIVMKEIVSSKLFNFKTSKVLLSKKAKKKFQMTSTVKKLSAKMNKEQTKKFFSIFEKDVLSPKTERVWLSLSPPFSYSREMTDQEIELSFYGGDKMMNTNYRSQLKNEFKKGLPCTVDVDRIKMLFGEEEEWEYVTKLVYFESANPITKTGILRFHFNYITYVNAQVK
jgi:hypothetical protein